MYGVEERRELFILTALYEKEGNFYCVPLNLCGDLSSEFLVFSTNSDTVIFLDSTFKEKKFLLLKNIPSLKSLLNIRIFEIDDYGHNAVSFISEKGSLFVIDSTFKLKEFYLSAISEGPENIVFKDISFVKGKGPSIFFVTEDDTILSFCLFEFFSKQKKVLTTRSGNLFEAFSEQNLHCFLVENENSFEILIFKDGSELKNKVLDKKIIAFSIIKGRNDYEVVYISELDKEQKVTKLLSFADGSIKTLFFFRAEKINKISPLEGLRSFFILADDSVLHIYNNARLSKQTIKKLENISIMQGLLGGKELSYLFDLTDDTFLIYDALMKKIGVLRGYISVYKFQRENMFGLAVNKKNGFSISTLNLNIFLVKKILFSSLFVIFIIFGLLTIVWLIFSLDFQLVLHNQLLAKSEDMIVVIDRFNRVLFINNKMKEFLKPFLCEHFHYRVNVKHLFSHQELKEIYDSYEKARNFKEEIETVLDVTTSNKRTTFLLHIAPILRRRTVLGYFLNMKDITEIMENRRMVTWALMARNIAHEIRNPLSSILLAIQRVYSKLKKEPDEKIEFFKNYLNVIKTETERIGYLVNTLLKLYLKDSSRLKAENLNPILMDLVESYKTKVSNISIETHFENDLPLIEIDRDLISMAISNIINNAIDAIRNEGYIKISTYTEKNHIIIKISDSGEGIEEDEIPKVTEMGYTTKTMGFGLGLTVAKEIVEKFKGEIKIASEKGKGTDVYLKFPWSEKSA